MRIVRRSDLHCLMSSCRDRGVKASGVSIAHIGGEKASLVASHSPGWISTTIFSTLQAPRSARRPCGGMASGQSVPLRRGANRPTGPMAGGGVGGLNRARQRFSEALRPYIPQFSKTRFVSGLTGVI
jgi:hypothetical protein